jgi:hypothetical protein
MEHFAIDAYQHSALGITSGTAPASPAQIRNQYHVYVKQSIGGTPVGLLPTPLVLRVPDLSAGMIQMGNDFNAPLPGDLEFGEE